NECAKTRRPWGARRGSRGHRRHLARRPGRPAPVNQWPGRRARVLVWLSARAHGPAKAQPPAPPDSGVDRTRGPGRVVSFSPRPRGAAARRFCACGGWKAGAPPCFRSPAPDGCGPLVPCVGPSADFRSPYSCWLEACPRP
ncbi:unnamed protein product, partial [Amoebophrya sp. A120]